jgi:polyphosphate kinase
MIETALPKTNARHYINRELSLLEFQDRVLEEALDENMPLLERVKFLAIFGSNMDEFFMVRVSGIRKLIEARVTELSVDGRTAREQFVAIHKKALALYNRAQKCYQRKLHPRLKKAGIFLLDYAQLNETQKTRMDQYFREVVFPVLTPLALDPGHPFPHISNLSMNLAIVIRDAKGNEKFSRLKVPNTLAQLVPIKRSSGGLRKDGSVPPQHYFIWLEQLIIANLGQLFPGMEVVSAHPFRVLRDADIEIQEIEAEDLLESMQQSIRKRKFGSVVQVLVNESMPESIRYLLVENLEINSSDVYAFDGHLGLVNFWQIYNSVELNELKYPHFKQHISPAFKDISLPADFFNIIDEKNILFHHPYDSFNPIVDFLQSAARDPHVLAIKQTLYRAGKNSPVVNALLEAAERGKQVAALVELKARFDEESNIAWARMLEQIGVHVVYGLIGLKTHCKIALVVRENNGTIRRYIHLGTGNYNAITSTIYEDMGILTCDPIIGEDITDLFNYLTGYSLIKDFKKLLVAPINLREKLEYFIRREIEHARHGQKAHIVIKVNSLADKSTIDLLYQASQAGVRVDLIVRGICCLRPGLKGISENIRVISVLGRFLEHSRMYYFYNNGQDAIYLGSADLMNRNLSQRVEVLFPVEDPTHLTYLRDAVLMKYLQPGLIAWVLQSDGTYNLNHPAGGFQQFDIQSEMMAQISVARA